MLFELCGMGQGHIEGQGMPMHSMIENFCSSVIVQMLNTRSLHISQIEYEKLYQSGKTGMVKGFTW